MGGSTTFSTVLGNGAMINWIRIADDDRALFEDWYNFEHLPERVSTPGFLRGRRFLATGTRTTGSTEFLTLYETANVGVLTSPEYLQRLDSPTELTQRVIPLFREFRRSACRLTCAHGAGSTGRVLAVEVARDAVADLRDRVDRLFPRLIAAHALHAGSLYEPDRAIGDAKAATSEGRSSTQQQTTETGLLLLEPQVGVGADEIGKEIDGELGAQGTTAPRELTLLFELRNSDR